MEMDFATSCPLVRPALPHIRFLFVGSRLCSTLPSDGPSRFSPCASLVLHLHQVAQGTCTPKTPGMPGTPTRAGSHSKEHGCETAASERRGHREATGAQRRRREAA